MRRWSFACPAKGVAAECPTGIDMAKMKVEFLSAYKARHGFTWKDRLVAHLPDYAEKIGRAAGFANLRDRLPGAARLSQWLTGFSARRSLPKWRRDNFWQTADKGFITREQALALAGSGAKVATLFVDTFNGHFDSENAAAAARVLQRAGYALHLAGKEDGSQCCGRTFLAAGMVDKARTKLSGAAGPSVAAGQCRHRHCRIGTILPAHLAR